MPSAKKPHGNTGNQNAKRASTADAVIIIRAEKHIKARYKELADKKSPSLSSWALRLFEIAEIAEKNGLDIEKWVLSQIDDSADDAE